MKKTLMLLLAILMLLTAAGCGSDGKQETLLTEPGSESPYNPEVFEDFEETTLADNDACKVSVTGMGTDPILGVFFNLYLENKTADKSLMFAFEDAAVNGVKWEPFFATVLEPGTQKNDRFSFFDSEKLERIGTFTDIELMLQVYENDKYTDEMIVRETLHLYPNGAENAKRHVREPQSTDIVLRDDENVTVIVTGYDPYSPYGYGVKVFFENKTDRKVTFGVKEATVNGRESNPWFTITVQPGKMAYEEMHWMDYKFKEGSRVTVREIGLKLSVHDYSDMQAETIYEETVTLNP